MYKKNVSVVLGALTTGPGPPVARGAAAPSQEAAGRRLAPLCAFLALLLCAVAAVLSPNGIRSVRIGSRRSRRRPRSTNHKLLDTIIRTGEYFIIK